MSKHTPGPWFAVGNWVEVEDDDSPDICTCNPSALGQGHLKFDWETIDANARLIAAAPNLLYALESCEAFLLSAGFESSDVYSEVCAAISRATP